MGRSRDLADADGALLSGFVFRNQLHNPRFAIAQRGNSIAASTGKRYGLDRWFVDSTGSTSAMSRQNFTLGQTDVPGNPLNFCRVDVTSVAGASNFAHFSQRIEGVQSLQGGKCRIRFWAKANAARSVAIELNQNFGTGGSPSAQVNLTVQKINLTTAWQRFSLTADVPSIAGKTLGSNGDDFLQLTFWLDAGSSFDSRTNSLGQASINFDIADVQLEAGSSVSPFEARPIPVELALCQRHYESGGITYSGVASASAQDFGLSYDFKVTKRASPTMAKSGTTFTNCVDQLTSQSAAGFYQVVRSSASGVVGYVFTWTASADL